MLFVVVMLIVIAAAAIYAKYEKKSASGPCCASCQTALRSNNTFQIDGKKYCENCYRKIKGPIPAESASPIAERLKAARLELERESNTNRAENSASPQSSAAQPASAAVNQSNQYNGIYRMNVQYQMMYFPNNELYTIEIQDNTCSLIRDNGIAPLTPISGEVDVAVFELTESEFELRQSGTPMNNPEVNTLIDRLLKDKPKDRLLSAFTFHPNTHSRTDLMFRAQADTMDDGALGKDKQRRLIAYLNKQEELHVIHSAPLEGRYPAIDMQGCAAVFTSEKYAVAYLVKNVIMNFSFKKYKKAEFDELVRSWYGLGITKLRLNPGMNGVTGLISRDEYLPDPNLKQWFACGSNLCQLILCFAQSQKVENDVPGMKATVASFWNLIAHELSETLFLTPMMYIDDTEAVVEDHELHLTQAAGKLFGRKTMEAMVGQRLPEDQFEFEVTDSEGNKVPMGADIDLLYGNKDFKLAEKAGKGTMQVRTIRNWGKTWLAACTDFAALEPVRQIYQNKTRVGAYTYDELVALLDSEVSDDPEGVAGIIINLGTTQMALDRSVIESIEKLRKEPSRVYIDKGDHLIINEWE